MANLPSGTVTFLFTDIEGSTAIWERDRQAMAAAVARHLTLLDAVGLAPALPEAASRSSVNWMSAPSAGVSSEPPHRWRQPPSTNRGASRRVVTLETVQSPTQVPSHLGSPSPSTRPDTRRGLLPTSCRRSRARWGSAASTPAGMVDRPGAVAAAGGDQTRLGVAPPAISTARAGAEASFAPDHRPGRRVMRQRRFRRIRDPESRPSSRSTGTAAVPYTSIRYSDQSGARLAFGISCGLRARLPAPRS
jgi:hypothetical protein